MLALLRACCGVRPPRRDPPAERTPLIPHADEPPPPQPRLVDHQKLKERLGSVVRSQQTKMVNVNAQSPFNLRPDTCGTVPSSPAPSPARSTVSLPPEGPSVLNVRLVSSVATHTTRGPAGDPDGHTQPLDLPPSAEHLHPPVDPEALPRPESFSIHDAGAVARSWGD